MMILYTIGIPILLTLGFLSALYPSVVSYKNMMRRFSESSLALFVCMVFYALTFLYGTVIRIGYSGGVDSLALRQINAMVAQAGYTAEMFTFLVFVCNVGLIVTNVIIGFIIQKTKKPVVYSLAFVILSMGLISILAIIVTGSNPLVNFFMECCGIMAYFAWMLDLTYKEFCVIGNIYIQAGICLFAAIAPLLLCLRTKKGMIATGVSLTNVLIHAVLFYVICVHYWMPLEQGFDLCYRELNQLAAFSGTSYVFVNIVIFVIIFVGDLVFNALLYKIINNS